MISTDLSNRVTNVQRRLVAELAALQTPDKHWLGRLSTSALSTATAVSALSLSIQAFSKSANNRSRDAVDQSANGAVSIELWLQLRMAGCEWLAKNQNQDGGFGDTERSHSNIATTYLVLAAWQLAGFTEKVPDQAQRAWKYVEAQGSWDGLRRRYGKDKTFVVPILTNCALAGLVPWRQVPPLPFEAAALPQSWYRLAKMPVVSYAIPALVAMGQAKFHFDPTWNPITRVLRKLSIRRTLRVLHRMQPDSGGYLEAVPLTSFVLMSLSGIGLEDLPVAHACRKFLVDSILADGSWPIDTNLATWVTSLTTRAALETTADLNLSLNNPMPTNPSSAIPASTKRILAHNDHHQPLAEETRSLITDETIEWLLSCQHRRRHPFTGADPGGWGWTDLSGAVPDADDTPAALIALECWYRSNANHPLRVRVEEAVELGVRWLLGLQNRDGGWPTFCRGWGQLPFDRSGSDLTAHAMRAIHRWRSSFPGFQNRQILSLASELDARNHRAMRFLEKTQFADGSWLPLWFGNQDRPDEDNPVYGTSRVLLALCELGQTDKAMAQRGTRYLAEQQNLDGGWGGGVSVAYDVSSAVEGNGQRAHRSTIEETALALESLVAFRLSSTPKASTQSDSQARFVDHQRLDASIERGMEWLCQAIESGWHHTSWPIGFYFAKLWYHEQMYPITYTLAAFAKLQAYQTAQAK